MNLRAIDYVQTLPDLRFIATSVSAAWRQGSRAIATQIPIFLSTLKERSSTDRVGRLLDSHSWLSHGETETGPVSVDLQPCMASEQFWDRERQQRRRMSSFTTERVTTIRCRDQTVGVPDTAGLAESISFRILGRNCSCRDGVLVKVLCCGRPRHDDSPASPI